MAIPLFSRIDSLGSRVGQQARARERFTHQASTATLRGLGEVLVDSRAPFGYCSSLLSVAFLHQVVVEINIQV